MNRNDYATDTRKMIRPAVYIVLYFPITLQINIQEEMGGQRGRKK